MTDEILGRLNVGEFSVHKVSEILPRYRPSQRDPPLAIFAKSKQIPFRIMTIEQMLTRTTRILHLSIRDFVDGAHGLYAYWFKSRYDTADISHAERDVS